MHVLMVLDKPFRTDLRVEREIRALLSEGDRVTLLCEGLPEEPVVGDFNGAELRRFHPPKGRLPRWHHYLVATFGGRSPIWERCLRDLVARDSFDVIHCHDLPVANSGIRVARDIRAQAVFDRHENWAGLLEGLHDAFPVGLRREILWRTINSPAVWRHWESTAVRSADLVITVSREAAEELMVTPNDLAVVSNYVDLDTLPDFTDALPASLPLRTCFTGVFNSMFALADMIRALCLLPPGAAELALVGDGDDRAHLERLVRERGLEQQVRFLGWRTREEALAEVRDAHLCLLPLRDNALTRTTVGNKLFEYMGMGRAVLCSGVGVMARIVRESGAGQVVDPWTPEGVAAAVEGLIADPARLLAMGQAGRAAVLSTYNWAREREAFLSAYARLRERRRCGGR
jgi:glycosyltransferase involved in cell wall biosynthesis